MAKNVVAIIGGYIVGPALATIFSFMDIHNNQSNSFTLPGYTTALLSFIAIFPSIIWVVNKASSPPSTVSRNSNVNNIRQNSVASMFSGSGLSGYGLVKPLSYSGLGPVEDVASWLTTKKYNLPVAPCIVCFLTYFSLTASFVIWETVGSALTHKYLQWSVFQNGILFTCMGLVAIIALWILKLLTHIIADKLILVASAVIAGSGTAVLIIPLAWSPIPFSIAMFLVALGYTLCINAVLQLFSGVLEKTPEVSPSALVWLSYCGSFARILGAVGAAYITTLSGM